MEPLTLRSTRTIDTRGPAPRPISPLSTFQPALETTSRSIVIPAIFSSVEYPKLKEAVRTAFVQLCAKQEGNSYSHELDAKAVKLGTTSERLLDTALLQLAISELKVDIHGKITNPAKIGTEFAAIADFIHSHVELHFIANPNQVEFGRVPVSKQYRHALERIIAPPGDLEREVVTIFVVRMPPESVRDEIRRITNTEFSGISTWMDADKRDHFRSLMSPSLQNWLDYATIRVMCTGTVDCICDVAKKVNHDLQTRDGLERRHLERLVRSISEEDRNESLRDVLKVCAPVIISIKILEKVMPGALHIVGGVLDDLFGCIIPDVSQSITKTGTRLQKIKQGASVFLGGSIGLPVSFAAGALSVYVYHNAETAMQRGASGLLFAIACCAGAVGTTVAAVIKAYRGVKKFEAKTGEHSKFSKRLWMAFDESVLKVPFRIGHTLIGLPAQLVLGLAAGVFGLFHSPVFIAVEGVFETVTGAAVAFLYPILATKLHEKRLRKGEPAKLPLSN